MGFVTNYIRNLGRVATGRQPLRPLLFSYYVTHRCGLSCRYCGDGEGRPFKQLPIPELPTGQAKGLIAELRRYSDTLDLTGGEPLLREDLEALLQFAKAQGFRTVLNTKGLGLCDRPGVLRHCDVLALSVDSLDASRLSKLLGASDQAAKGVLRSLEYLLGLKDRPKLVLSAVATKENLEDVGELLELARRERVGFAFSPEIVGRKVDPALEGNPVYRALVDRAIKAKAEGAHVLGVDRYLEGVRDLSAFSCHPLLMPTIRPDGRMNYPCLEVVEQTYDLKPSGGFEEARQSLARRGVPLPSCDGQCHIFCHMALSLLQRHPLSALDELRRWS